ncbi:MAG: oligosaccharide flippase family protein [Candidatus Bathyarchaeia archaeon]|jgi:O-antigen/teichoic acid export membrane protein
MSVQYNTDSAVEISRGASYLVIQTVVTSIVQVISFAILARIITPSEVGILAILSLITALSQAINGGAFQQASMKYVGEFSGTQKEIASSVFYQTFRVSLILSLPLAAFIFFGATVLSSTLLGTVAQAGLFRFLAVDVLAYAGALPVAIGAILGAKRFKAAATIGSGGAVLRQCLIILLILLLKDFIGLVYAMVLSDFTMLTVYGLYVVRVLGLPKTPFPLRKLLNFSWPLSIGNVITFAYSWFDRAILIAFVPLASLGVYNAALTAFTALNNISNSVNNALLPAYSDLSGRKGLEGCRRATWLASRYASLVMVPLALGLLATAKPALTLFVGQAYVNGTEPLMILSGVLGLTVFGIALGPMLVALSRTRSALLITASSVLLALISAYVFLPIFGIIGAAIARGVAMVVSLGLTIVILRRNKAILLDIETIWKTVVAGAVMAAVLVFAQMVVYNRILLPIYMVLGALVYLILLRMLKAVRRHDVELIERYLGPRLGFASRLLSVILVTGGPLPKLNPPTNYSPHIPLSGMSPAFSMNERIVVQREEFEGFLADNQVLLDRCQEIIGKVDELEEEKRKLSNDLKDSKAKLDSAEASVTDNMRQTGEALRTARETMARLNREADKRISADNPNRTPFICISEDRSNAKWYPVILKEFG